MSDDLFSKVYNPDVLSCLANLSNDEVFTSPDIVNQMLDMLPQDIFENPDTTFLDPACKTGVFLREIAKRLIKGLENQIPDLQERIDHIFQKQLYGIAITELTSLLSRRSVYCSKYANSDFSVSRFKDAAGNIRFKIVNHSFKNGKCMYCGASKAELGNKNRENMETYAYEFIHNMKVEEVFKMKFDVIISNPPYQLSDGGGNNGSSAMPIYQYFVEKAKSLNPTYLAMIIPSRWFTGGKGLDDFRKNMIFDHSISELHDFCDSKECFPGVSIEGGVCYFLRKREYSGPCKITTHLQDKSIIQSIRYLNGNGTFDIFIRLEQVEKIVLKILDFKYPSFSTIVSNRNPFDIGSDEKKKPLSVEPTPNSLRVYGRFDRKRGYKFVDSNYIIKGQNYVGKFKLFISKANGAAGQIGNPVPARIIGKTVVGEPNDICSETFLVVGPIDSIKRTENIQKYMKTKFFRFLTGARKNKNMTADTYKYVPLLDFSKSYSDQELYNLFQLDEKEQEYIENMISDNILDSDDQED